MAFAESHFALEIVKDGSSVRDHLKRAANATHKVPEELKNLPELPESAAHVWKWFLDLNSTRSATQFGLCKLSYTEILAWQELTKEKLSRWEVKAIKALDMAFLNRKE